MNPLIAVYSHGEDTRLYLLTTYFLLMNEGFTSELNQINQISVFLSLSSHLLSVSVFYVMWPGGSVEASAV